MAMTGLTSRIEQRLRELNLTPRAASLRVSNNPDMFRSVMRFGDETNPKIETLAKMAEALETTVGWLQFGEAVQTSPQPRRENEYVPADVAMPPMGQLPRNVPVLGTALGSLVDDKFEGFHLEGTPIDYVRRPPGLAHVVDAYAIYVQNDSMWPMHPPGDLRFVNPHKPPRAGGTVVVQTRHWDNDPGQGYIKIFRRRTSTMLILEQLNPPATIEIPLKFVVSIHHVPDMAELFGV